MGNTLTKPVIGVVKTIMLEKKRGILTQVLRRPNPNIKPYILYKPTEKEVADSRGTLKFKSNGNFSWIPEARYLLPNIEQ